MKFFFHCHVDHPSVWGRVSIRTSGWISINIWGVTSVFIGILQNAVTQWLHPLVWAGKRHLADDGIIVHTNTVANTVWMTASLCRLRSPCQQWRRCTKRLTMSSWQRRRRHKVWRCPQYCTTSPHWRHHKVWRRRPCCRAVRTTSSLSAGCIICTDRDWAIHVTWTTDSALVHFWLDCLTSRVLSKNDNWQFYVFSELVLYVEFGPIHVFVDAIYATFFSSLLQFCRLFEDHLMPLFSTSGTPYHFHPLCSTNVAR